MVRRPFKLYERLTASIESGSWEAEEARQWWRLHHAAQSSDRPEGSDATTAPA
jgi:hypothetical protein